MRSWQMERYPCGDRRLPHHIYPPKIYTNDQLQALTAERKMSTSDILTLHENMNDFERKLEQFYEPVAKNVDSVFLVMDGSAYYDIEVDEDNWIRINVERGDLIIIPRGHNYRFTLTTENKVVIERFLTRILIPNKANNSRQYI
ncbi:hypothetical protein DINM_002027 [Dirofilaria immitis]|nr:hypothetical protein [Dirofilaria immitis]